MTAMFQAAVGKLTVGRGGGDGNWGGGVGSGCRGITTQRDGRRRVGGPPVYTLRGTFSFASPLLLVESGSRAAQFQAVSRAVGS